MREAVLVSAVRTPVAKIKGGFAKMNVDQLGGIVIREALRRAGAAPDEVEEVIFGNCRNVDLKTPARVAAIAAGLPETVPAFTVERGCASGLNAIWLAAMSVMQGEGDIYVAGGMESTTKAPFLMASEMVGNRMPPRWLFGRSLPEGMEDPSMGMTAEKIAATLGITREECDAFAVESHARAARAQRDGRFDAQLVPVEAPFGKNETRLVTMDETVRPDTSVESLKKLRTSFDKNGVCTAGNSSPLTDGAAAVVVMSRETAEKRGLEILGTVRAFASAGLDPSVMGLGPVYAVRKLLNKTGLTMDGIDLIELNEAFAPQSLGCIRQLGLVPDKVNVNGGAIALGHPFGATGAILTTKLVYEMRRRGAKRGVVTFCIGGGQGAAMLIEGE